MKFINTLICIFLFTNCQTKTEQSNNVVNKAPVIVQNDTVPLLNSSAQMSNQNGYGVDWWWSERKYNFDPNEYKVDNQLFRLWLDSTDKEGSLTLRIQQKVNRDWKNVYEREDWSFNNAGYGLGDWNNDGFKDLIISKKWGQDAILYNTKLKNYVDIGDIGDTVIQVDKSIFYAMTTSKTLTENATSKEYESWSSDLFSLDEFSKRKTIARAYIRSNDSLHIVIKTMNNDTFAIINPRKLKEYFEEDNNSISFDSQSFLKKYWADNWAKF
jgi:hypothetical protein